MRPRQTWEAGTRRRTSRPRAASRRSCSRSPALHAAANRNAQVEISFKLMYAAVLRAVASRRGVTVAQFEPWQMRVLRDQLNRSHTLGRATKAGSRPETAALRVCRSETRIRGGGTHFQRAAGATASGESRRTRSYLPSGAVMILMLGAWTFLRALLGSSGAVSLENVALHHQLAVLQQSVRRPRFPRRDRIF